MALDDLVMSDIYEICNDYKYFISQDIIEATNKALNSCEQLFIGFSFFIGELEVDLFFCSLTESLVSRL